MEAVFQRQMTTQDLNYSLSIAGMSSLLEDLPNCQEDSIWQSIKSKISETYVGVRFSNDTIFDETIADIEVYFRIAKYKMKLSTEDLKLFFEAASSHLTGYLRED